MISPDQPTLFPTDVTVAVSSKKDGSMLDRAIATHEASIVKNRQAFCQNVGIRYDNVVFQYIIYDKQRRYDQISEVDKGATTTFTKEHVADALFTKSPDVGLFLPVADCIVAVVHDPTKHYLALLHLGRDSTVAHLMQRVIDKFIYEGSHPEDLLVWMSPSAKPETYAMQWFDQENEPEWQEFIDRKEDGIYLDLPGFNQAACQNAGIPPSNISISPINTMTHPDYYSHARGDTSGRFAVVAMMRS